MSDDWCELPINVTQVISLDRFSHKVALPTNLEYQPLHSNHAAVPTKDYSFVLDPFQKEAFLCLDNNQSVFVSAHTSAAMTVVADYVISMSLKAKQRVIYITNNHLFSNHKLRHFNESDDVGMVTRGNIDNCTASCLFMSIDMLRGLLNQDSEITKEVAWVIFEDFHEYVHKKKLGVTFKQVINLFNDKVHYVFLSATIPNVLQFAQWIAHLHKQPCHVVENDNQQTSMQHCIYPAGGDDIHRVVHENVSESFSQQSRIIEGQESLMAKMSSIEERLASVEQLCSQSVTAMQHSVAPIRHRLSPPLGYSNQANV